MVSVMKQSSSMTVSDEYKGGDLDWHDELQKGTGLISSSCLIPRRCLNISNVKIIVCGTLLKKKEVCLHMQYTSKVLNYFRDSTSSTCL
jgi:hypothetical protein